jgi:hypothetical protein
MRWKPALNAFAVTCRRPHAHGGDPLEMNAGKTAFGQPTACR